MELAIYDKNTRLRIDVISAFSYVNYVDKFNGAGSFSVKVPFNSRLLDSLKRGNLIHFQRDDMGIIEYVHKSTTGFELQIEVKGHMINKLLDTRVSITTEQYSGTLEHICVCFVENNIVTPTDSNRKIDLISLAQEHTSLSRSERYQSTGGTIGEAVSEVLSVQSYGYKLIPQIINYDSASENPVNLQSLVFTVLEPVDRTIDNTDNNAPVVFSTELSNVKSLEYTEDGSDFCSMAYVAGEGEGQERTVLPIGSTSSSGLERVELYVDARDIQKIDPVTQVSMTDQEYEELLELRGKTKLEEHLVFTAFDGQLNAENSIFKLGTDYNCGDFVTVVDKDLNIVASVQITAVSHSISKTGEEKIDLTLGTEKASVIQLIKKKGVM